MASSKCRLFRSWTGRHIVERGNNRWQKLTLFTSSYCSFKIQSKKVNCWQFGKRYGIQKIQVVTRRNYFQRSIWNLFYQIESFTFTCSFSVYRSFNIFKYKINKTSYIVVCLWFDINHKSLILWIRNNIILLLEKKVIMLLINT